MIEKTAINGNLRIRFPVFEDHRGRFEVFWEEPLFHAQGVSFRPTNAYHSHNLRRGTIRAFHYQCLPHGQAKLVTCVSGRIRDIAVDLRKDSPTYRQWSAVDMVAGGGSAHLIPAGCAHGFATLEDHSTVAYLIEGEYRPEAARVVRWNDPTLGVSWPFTDPVLSEKDANAPLLSP